MKHFISSATRLLVLCALSSLPALAQPTSGGPTPGNQPTPVPIDGGVSLLLAAGGAYGLKRLRNRRAKSAKS